MIFNKLLSLRLYVLSLLFIVTSATSSGFEDSIHKLAIQELYDELCLDEYGMDREVLNLALMGMKHVGSKLAEPVLTIADFSQPSTAKRLYIIDIYNKKLLFNTYVAHGRNSGDKFAEKFSDEPESYQSSLGVYLTGEVYAGRHGISLTLKGQDAGLNSRAEERAIVMHGADYATEDFIRKTGRLGRSLGCPAVNPELAKPIIDQIKNGTCFFIYHPELKKWMNEKA